MNEKITWNKPTADALAVLIANLRGDWQMPGIMAALADPKLRDRDPFAVVCAAVKAARDPKVRTPAVIAMDGQHWQEPAEVRVLPQPLPWNPDVLSDAERQAAAQAAEETRTQRLNALVEARTQRAAHQARIREKEAAK